MGVIMDLFFNEKYCFHFDEITQEELFEYVGNILIVDQVVTNEYVEAIRERERVYPTGFDLQEIHVAIPHVESKYINKNGIWCAAIKNGCKWYNIEEETEELNVTLIFGLLITNSNQQIELLQRVTKAFRQIDKLKKISTLENRKDIHNMLLNDFDFINH